MCQMLPRCMTMDFNIAAHCRDILRGISGWLASCTFRLGLFFRYLCVGEVEVKQDKFGESIKGLCNFCMCLCVSFVPPGLVLRFVIAGERSL